MNDFLLFDPFVVSVFVQHVQTSVDFLPFHSIVYVHKFIHPTYSLCAPALLTDQL